MITLPTRRPAFALPVLLVALLGLLLGPPPAEAGGRGFKLRLSGDLETTTFDVEDFDSIHVDGVADVDLEIGEDWTVELETDVDLIDFVEVYVRRGVLVIDQEDDLPNLVGEEAEYRFRIVMPELKRISVDGVADLDAEDLDLPSLDIRVDGVADIELTGEVEELDVEVDGVGDVDLRGLVARTATVDVDGVGDVNVHVTERLDARVDGMGNVEYWGDPERVRESVNGLGDIVRH
jgi:hypothetical protein